MARRSGSEPPAPVNAPGPLILLATATIGSGLLFAGMPSEGWLGSLRVLSLLPLQLAALFWVLPRMR